MAALAIPALEAVAVRVLAALGGGAAAGVAGEAAIKEARKRREAAEQAKSAPIARTEATTQARTKCKECPPDHGSLVRVNYSMPPNSIAYQAKITGFPPGMEWEFAGKDFDGFQSSLCLLQEAKADYDQFFDPEGEFRYIFQKGIFIKMEAQAMAQARIVRTNPPAALSYYFQTEPVRFSVCNGVMK